jgi:predicted DCC family thiol-disulfide oxidoreductase YuxK
LPGRNARPTLADVKAASTSSPDGAVVATGPVLFFDGACGLCQRIVRVLLRLDRGARLSYAALQSPVAQAYLRCHGLPTEDFDSLVFVPDWGRRDRPEFLRRTAGVIAALRVTGGAGARLVAGLLALLPERIRDAGYRGIARGRHAVFGPWRERPLRRPEWEGRFLT